MPSAVIAIDLAAIRANWRALDALSGPGTETAAVVKADAYGCGAAEVGPALAAEGVRSFFVAHLAEGTALRIAVGPDPAIYVLNGFSAGEEGAFGAADLRPVLSAPEQVAAAAPHGLRAAIQFDTGMNRLGLEAGEIAPAREALGTTEVTLVMSHLHSSDVPGDVSPEAQRRTFEEMRAAFPGIPASLAATGGVLLGDAFHFDLARPGVGLFGGLPFAEARPVVSLHAPILQVREVAPGEAVGYGATWRAERPSRIATIPVGYADGLIRAAGNRGTAFLDGQPLPFAGRVSMDLTTLDVTDCPAAVPGAMVELLGPNQTVDQLAEAAGTIGYEILTSLGHRYARTHTG